MNGVLHLVCFHKHGVFSEVHLQMINRNHLAGYYMLKKMDFLDLGSICILLG